MKTQFRNLAGLFLPFVLAGSIQAGSSGWTEETGFNPLPPGWLVGGPAAVFTVPQFSQAGDTHGIYSAGNTNCFGYIESFFDTPITSFQPGDISKVRGIFVARFRNYVEANAKENAPTIRCRFSKLDFSQAAVTAIESVGDTSFLPELTMGIPDPSNDPMKLASYYTALEFPTSAGFVTGRYSFDLLNFGGANDPSGALYLDDISYRLFYTQDLSLIDSEVIDLTTSDRDSWNFVGPPGLISPINSSTSNGLSMRASTNGEPAGAVFGFWEGSSTLNFMPGAIYRIEWTIATGAGVGDGLSVPTVRLRGNVDSFQVGWYLNLESTDATLMPTSGTSKTFRSYLVCTEGTSQPVKLAFDYLWVPGDGNNPVIPVTLKKCTINRIANFP